MKKLHFKNQKQKYLIIFILLLFIYCLLIFFGIFDKCYVKESIGMPCAGCGMTRAYRQLLTGDIMGAFYYHPLFFIPPLTLCLLLLVFLERITVPVYIWIAIIVVFVGTYFIRLYLYFPHTAPMDYNFNAPVARLFMRLRLMLLGR